MTTTVKNKTNNSKVEIVKLGTINNGQLVLDRVTRKPIDQIGKKANKLTTSILATGSKSNALISKAMFDLIGYDMQLMSLDFKASPRPCIPINFPLELNTPPPLIPTYVFDE